MSDDLKLCLKILDEAIIFEEEGMRFFQDRESGAPSALERNVFKSLAADEAGHRDELVAMRETLKASGDVESLAMEEHEVRDKARRIFSQALEAVEDTDPYQADQLEILRGALELEKRGYDMYRRGADSVTSPRAKEIFEHLASEEQEHYRLLKNTLDYFTDPLAFNGFDESPMLDGG